MLPCAATAPRRRWSARQTAQLRLGVPTVAGHSPRLRFSLHLCTGTYRPTCPDCLLGGYQLSNPERSSRSISVGQNPYVWRVSCLDEPLHVLTDRASGRTLRNVFASLFRFARGYRLCDRGSTLFLGSGTVAGSGHGPAAWVGVRVSSLNGKEFFWYGATPLIA